MVNYIGNIDTNNIISLSLFNISLDFDKLSKEILQHNIKTSDNPLSTLNEDFVFPDTPNSEALKFKETIDNFFETKGLKLAGIWSHVHQPLESTNTHAHIGNGVVSSFVFYVKVPLNSGKFVIDFSTTFRGPRIPLSPIEGNLLLFPSWLPHMVTKNYSNQTRISISGNLVPLG